MAEAVKEKNLFLVNAPAGSGKTTFIQNKINDILKNDKFCNILCITFTNRAADELLSKINSKNVTIGTIHSFISDFLRIYFSDKSVLCLYFDEYKQKIEDRISNPDKEESNQEYKDKHDGNLSFEYIKNSVTKIKYNESANNTLYYGGLSHDDLLSFAELMMNKYSILKKRLKGKYKYIFIDEYQDTSANILRFFYNAAKDSNTKLFLCGDRMQQIYKNYDGTFEECLKEFDNTEYLLRTNYRSTKNIVRVLNNLYNDKNFIQESNEKEEGSIPQIYITNDTNALLNTIEQENPDILKLFIFNRDRFEKIGAVNLYNSLLKKYPFGSNYSPVDILTQNDTENPDPIFRLLFEINDFLEKYKLKQYGLLVQKIKNRKLKYNKELLQINKNKDKEIFHFIIDSVNNKFNEDITILEFLQFLRDKRFILNDELNNCFENMEDEKYSAVLNQKIAEFRNICEYLKNPKISTQHGVKGEGHDEVVFIAEDSNNPKVKMYKFFELFSKNDINYTDFENFYYEYKKDVCGFEKKYNISLKELNKDIHIYEQNT